MQGYWDIIFDIDAFLQGNETIVEFTTVQEWIKYIEEILEKDGKTC